MVLVAWGISTTTTTLPTARSAVAGRSEEKEKYRGEDTLMRGMRMKENEGVASLTEE
jgi:hypothetical protein